MYINMNISATVVYTKSRMSKWANERMIWLGEAMHDHGNVYQHVFYGMNVFYVQHHHNFPSIFSLVTQQTSKNIEIFITILRKSSIDNENFQIHENIQCCLFIVLVFGWLLFLVWCFISTIICSLTNNEIIIDRNMTFIWHVYPSQSIYKWKLVIHTLHTVCHYHNRQHFS